MHKKWIQKTSTSFLLVLFIFIHAVKTFHTHSYADACINNAFSKNTTIVKPGFACAICDFQIAKDSDAESATFSISTPSHFIITYYKHTLIQVHTYSVTSSVRGPPSFIV